MTQKNQKILVHKLYSGYLIEYDGKKIACKNLQDAEEHIIGVIKSSFWFHGKGVETTEITYSAIHNQ